MGGKFNWTSGSGGRGPLPREYDRDFFSSVHSPGSGSAISREDLEERLLASQREEAERRSKEELRAQFLRLWNSTTRFLIALRHAKYQVAGDAADVAAARQGLLARAEEVARMASTVSDAERRQQLTALERSCRNAAAQITSAGLP